MRTITAICTLAIFSLGAVMADDFVGRITKIETKDGTTTITGTRGKKGEEKDFKLTVAEKAKIAKGKYSFKDMTAETGDDIKEGFKSDLFKDVSTEKPLRVYLTTDKKDVVTQLLVIEQKGKKKDDK